VDPLKPVSQYARFRLQMLSDRVGGSILGVIRGGRSQRYLRKKTVLLSDELLELGGGFKYFLFSPRKLGKMNPI